MLQIFLCDNILTENMNVIIASIIVLFFYNNFISIPEMLIVIMNRGNKVKFECNFDFSEQLLDLKILYTRIKDL